MKARRSRRLIVAGLAGGLAVIALFGLGPVRSGADEAAPPETLRRVAARNGEAAANAVEVARLRSQASAEAADERTMAKAEANEH